MESEERIKNINSYKIAEVFGVRKDMVLSYIERKQVDGKFLQSLSSDKHIETIF